MTIVIDSESEKEATFIAQQTLAVVLKRAYEEPAESDGTRVLIERLWPRGISKERAHIDLWLKDVAPSTELRTWFHHDPEEKEYAEAHTATASY